MGAMQGRDDEELVMTNQEIEMTNAARPVGLDSVVRLADPFTPDKMKAGVQGI